MQEIQATVYEGQAGGGAVKVTDEGVQFQWSPSAVPSTRRRRDVKDWCWPPSSLTAGSRGPAAGDGRIDPNAIGEPSVASAASAGAAGSGGKDTRAEGVYSPRPATLDELGRLPV